MTVSADDALVEVVVAVVAAAAELRRVTMRIPPSCSGSRTHRMDLESIVTETCPGTCPAVVVDAVDAVVFVVAVVAVEDTDAAAAAVVVGILKTNLIGLEWRRNHYWLGYGILGSRCC